MSGPAPRHLWWSSTEIAAARLPGLPHTKRQVNVFIERAGWARVPDRARRRRGRGGGWEYHWSLLPLAAQQLLLMLDAGAEENPETKVETPGWDDWEFASENQRGKARDRLRILQLVDTMQEAGLGKDLAVKQVAGAEGKSPRAVWSWYERINGVAEPDRLPALLDAVKRPKRGLHAAGPAIDPDFFRWLLSDWLRLGEPSLTSCYDRTLRIAAAEGWTVPPIHSVRRKIKRELSPQVVIGKRKGVEALKRLYPPQSRDKTAMHALEAVNGDYHRFDVFVRFPADVAGQREEVARVQMVAFQDVYSGKLLSWRLDRTANSHTVQLAIGDLIEDYGIPFHALLDNGREFAAKVVTGGTPTRFRFKVRDEDVPGLLTELGCKIHWATPYSGQSKPIERAFRDLCDRIAKHPAFQGAYTGNRPDAKPEDYGTRAIPLDAFTRIVAEEIEAHNMRRGRRSEVACGRSFAEVFAESYATAPIRKAVPEQRRLWLMGAEGVRAASGNGQVRFMRNSYWAPWMPSVAGQRIVARFDKAALWDGIHVYAMSGEYLGHAPCTARGQFFDVDDARAHAKARRDWLSAERKAIEAYDLLSAAELGRRLEELSVPGEDRAPEASVVQMMPTAQKAPPRAPEPAVSETERAARDAVIFDLTRRRSTEIEETTEEDASARYMRARELEAFDPASLTKEQRTWLELYQRSGEYAGLARLERMTEPQGKEGGRAE